MAGPFQIMTRDEHTINNSGPLVIPAGGYLILGNNADQASNGGLAVDYQYNLFTLSNSADELVLTTPDLVEVDRVEWDGGPDFPAPEGASISLLAVNLDNTDGTNWCEATTPYGDGDFGTPAAPNDCPPPPTADLQITEIWAGQNGSDLTSDWFEITNFGDIPWISGVNGNLFYEDGTQDPADATPIIGINDIQPGGKCDRSG